MAQIYNVFFLSIWNCIFILKSLTGQADGCGGGLIVGDTGSLQIESSHRPCLRLISLQNKTGLRVTISPRLLKPILVIPQQRVSYNNPKYDWVNGSENVFYEFEAKSLAVFVPPGREESRLSWTGMHADSFQVYFETKLLSESNRTVELEHERDGRYEIFWAFHHATTGQLSWNLDTVLPACEPKDPCESISFAVLEISPDGNITVKQKTCEGGTRARDIKLTVRSTVLFLLHINTPVEAKTSFQVTWENEEYFKKPTEGIIADSRDLGLVVIPLNSTHQELSGIRNHSIVGLTFDWNSSKIYFIAIGLGILRAKMDGSEPETLLDERNLVGLAIEPTTGNFYYVHTPSEAMRVCNNDANKCTTISNISLSGLVFDITIHWSKGLLFWVVYHIGIVRANLDGSNETEILKGHTVQGIDLDEDEDRLYWGFDGGIGSCGLNGEDIKWLTNVETDTYDVAIAGENVYYSIWDQPRINVISKQVNNSYPVEYANYKAKYLAVYGKRVSSLPPNPCAKLNCAHLCILSSASSYRCVCPDGAELAGDQRTCSV